MCDGSVCARECVCVFVRESVCVKGGSQRDTVQHSVTHHSVCCHTRSEGADSSAIVAAELGLVAAVVGSQFGPASVDKANGVVHLEVRRGKG